MDKLQELITNYELYKVGLYKEPHSIATTTEHDNGIGYPLGTRGKDVRTNHLIQNIDYQNYPIKYEYNELGLRGPQPKENYPFRIMFGGSCTFFGEGVNIEDSFPHILSEKLDANYINVSDGVHFTKMLQEIDGHAEWYKPHLLVLGATRFFDVFEFIDAYLRLTMKKSYLVDKEIPKRLRDELRGQLKERNYDLLKYIFKYLNDKYPQVIFVHHNDVYYKKFNDMPHHGVQTLYLGKKHMIDLSKECRHPGPKTHKLMADKIYEIYKRQSSQKI